MPEVIPATYLLHFHEPIHHASHYIGATDDVIGRIVQHCLGRGANITKVARERGVKFAVGGLWTSDDPFELEQWMKKQKRGPEFCCFCNRMPRFPVGMKVQSGIYTILPHVVRQVKERIGA